MPPVAVNVLKLVGKLFVPPTTKVPATVRVPPAALRFAVNVKRSKVPLVTDKFPTIEVFTPRVVVPPFIIKLLKLVNSVDGNVLLASKVTDPVPGVQVFPVTVLTIRLPVINVELDVIVIIPGAGVERLLPSVTLPALRVEPLTKVIVPVLMAFPSPPT